MLNGCEIAIAIVNKELRRGAPASSQCDQVFQNGLQRRKGEYNGANQEPSAGPEYHRIAVAG